MRRSEAIAHLKDPDSRYMMVTDGSGKRRFTRKDFQPYREYSPSSITVTEMKMNVGEYGDPKPESRRRDGYIDPIAAAREKIEAWRSVR
jgi:hypothetical protein